MKKQLLSASILLGLVTLAHTQESNDQPPQAMSPMVPLTYVGSNARIGVSVDNDGDFTGEGLGILRYTGLSSVLLEGWIGNGGAGGLELGYNWVWGANDAQMLIDEPEKLWVAKVFGALDRNSESDRKLTIGVGAEKEDLFFTGYLSKGLTDERFVSSRSTAATDFITGTDNGRPFRQDRTITTIFDTYEEAMNFGVGARLGKYFDSNLFRIRGGLDFGRGDSNADQLTASIGVDKFFEGTGHSLSLDLAHANRDGDFVVDDNDTQTSLTYRYAFGESYRPAAWEHAMANAQAENPETKAVDKAEPVVVRNDVKLDSDAFFDFDKNNLRSETKAELDRLIEIIKKSKLASGITVIGHTCSIGTDAYNLGLSNRRANAVAEYLKASGIDAEFVVDGKGESEPEFPNDSPANRKKNRRVDVNFVTIEEKFEEAQMPAADGAPVTYTKQKITVPPGWIERALRNPTDHRRAVDTFTTVKTRQETTLGARTFLNRGPAATNDTASVRRNSTGQLIAVLGNDTDPDGDSLTVASVTQPANGTATVVSNGVIYTPRAGFTGTDTFTYTISDGKGGTATATVTITVADQPPVAVDDAATVARSGTVTVNPLSNDSDPEGGVLRVTGIDQPANGTAVLEGNTVRYTAPAGFAGTATIPYRIVDDAGNVANARIIVTVSNAAPLAGADNAATSVGRPVTINVLGNDSDPDGDAITLSSVSTPANGRTFIENGRVVYTPNAGFSGTDTFTYVVRDALGATATGTVTVTVQPNRAPVAANDEAGVLKAQSVDINVLANDVDPDGDALTVVSATGARLGDVTVNANGTVRYAHRPGSTGTDTFTYTVRDTAGNTSTATVTVRILRITLP